MKKLQINSFATSNIPEGNVFLTRPNINQRLEEAIQKPSVSILVSKDKDEVVGIIDCFARNFVFPCSLSDLLSDMGHADFLAAAF